jgi:Reverse transcriptase (RNA-dependent DNA polymerase)
MCNGRQRCIVEGSKGNLYIKLPDGRYARLKKYIYGLKQAGYEWNKLLCETLQKYRYIQSKHDPCVFYKHYDKGYIIMTTHVDDFYAIASEDRYLDELHKALCESFGEVTIKHGNILSYLGMEIKKIDDI